MFSAGSYYIGDVCYILDDQIYHQIWGKTYQWANGVIHTQKGNFWVHGTYLGDGLYESNQEHSYSVDAGVIGIVPQCLFDDHKVVRAQTLGSFHQFTGPVTYSYNDGTFIITCPTDNFLLHIWTGSDADEDEDEDEDAVVNQIG